MKDIFCFSWISQYCLNDGFHHSQITELCSLDKFNWTTVRWRFRWWISVYFYSIIFPPSLPYIWQQAEQRIETEKCSWLGSVCNDGRILYLVFFWHLHTIMLLSLVIQYGTLLSSNSHHTTTDNITQVYSLPQPCIYIWKIKSRYTTLPMISTWSV